MKNLLVGVSVFLAVAICVVCLQTIQKPPVDEIKPAPPVVEEIVEEEPEPIVLTFDDALNSISKEELKEDLYYLASDQLEGRMSGKKGNVLAAEFIKKEFDKAGLPTMYDKFKIDRLNPGPNNETGDDFTQNIYAWIEGSDPVLKNEIIVIGAHMDHIGYGPSMSRSPRQRSIHPGADDNASGTVALLEMAEALALVKSQIKRTIVFQAYSAEEMGLIGSRYYCSEPKFPLDSPDIKKHIFMLNMDMVGYLGKGRFLASWGTGNSSIDVDSIVDELDGKYSFAKNITSRGSGGSDHASFYNKRVPIAFLHTGSHPHYHTPSDTPDKINYEGLESVTKYGLELIWKIDQTTVTPTFNLEAFMPMDYDHDHGHEIKF